MTQITGLQEMRFLAHGGGDAARLADLARAVGVLEADADPDVAGWEASLLDLRRALTGPRITAELTCPACGKGIALIFGVDDLPRQTEAKAASVDGVPLRPLRLSDLEAIEALPGDRMAETLARATGKSTAWAREVLDGPGQAEAVQALEQALSGLNLELGTQCTACGFEFVSPFDVQCFVMAERTGSAQRLLDEVHLMARTYHWSEADILALPRDRRLAYLARIERDDLRIEVGDARY